MDKVTLMSSLPDGKGCVVVLSGGMDSTTAMRLCVEKYGSENVRALTFNYGQKQKVEIERAAESTALLGVKHKVLDLSLLGEIGQGFSANLDQSIEMPTIQDVIGDPRPKTYVPNRNMILMSIAAAYAEVEGLDCIVAGFQARDSYGYFDTTQRWTDKLNDLLTENRIIKIKIITPFVNMSKQEELEALYEVDGNLDLLKHTLTCYNPNESAESCGKCPTCAERIKAFMDFGQKDPVPYSIDIPWSII